MSNSKHPVWLPSIHLSKSDQKRITHVEGDNAALNSRMATIEERLRTVEQKLNLPPGA